MMDYLWLIEIAVSIVTGGLLWQVWNLRQKLTELESATSGAKQNSWENKLAIQELARDHTDIKDMLKEHRRDSEDFKQAIADLQKEHSSHNEIQAKILQLCEILERRKHCG